MKSEAMSLALAAAVFSAPAVAGAEAHSPDPEVPAAPSAADPPARLSAAAGVGVASRYYFRGILQQDTGAIVQPAVELGATLHEGDGPLTELALTTGLWSSVHSEAPGARPGGAGPGPWYEADFFLGASARLAEQWELGASYTAYASPNGSFATVHELGASISWDDSSRWENVLGGRFAGLSPTAAVAAELKNTAFGEDEGVYLELGAAPSIDLLSSPSVSLATSMPLTVGLSARDYYTGESGEGERFGFFGAGLAGSADLAFVPASYGSWSFGLSAHLLFLGSATGALADVPAGRPELIVLSSLEVAY